LRVAQEFHDRVRRGLVDLEQALVVTAPQLQALVVFQAVAGVQRGRHLGRMAEDADRLERRQHRFPASKVNSVRGSLKPHSGCPCARFDEQVAHGGVQVLPLQRSGRIAPAAAVRLEQVLPA
jgi:hypothetical protein